MKINIMIYSINYLTLLKELKDKVILLKQAINIQQKNF